MWVPNCACEPWSLTGLGGAGIDDNERLARVLTSPDAYDESSEAILTGKLTQIYSMGMSVIRQGASSDEIRQTIDALVSSSVEPRKLVGAVVVEASMLRSYINEDDSSRWFGAYATDDRGKLHHGDILGTGASKGQQHKRRQRLADDLLPLLVKAEDPDALIAALRDAGI